MRFVLGMVGWILMPLDRGVGLCMRVQENMWRWSSCLKVPLSEQRGSVNLGGTLILGISMIFVAIGFIFLPITTSAAQDLLDYQYSANATITDATYTGFTAVVGITPLLILVGFLSAAVISGFMGVRVMQGSGAARVSPGGLIMIGLSIIFIAIGLIVEPVALDGISSVLHGGGSGISASFTGYSAMILVSPLLVHIGFISAAVFSGMFGLKTIGGGGN